LNGNHVTLGVQANDDMMSRISELQFDWTIFKGFLDLQYFFKTFVNVTLYKL